MSVHKIRRNLAVAGNLFLGSAADAGLARSAAGTIRPLGSNGLAGGTIDVSAGKLQVPHTAGALTNAAMGTAGNGNIRVGYNGNVVQLGFVVNGSAIILQATAGTGAVTAAVGA